MNTFTDDRDGSTYPTVQIGDQWWMAENLKHLPSVSPISQRPIWRPWQSVQNHSQTQPFCYVYGYQGRRVREAKSTANYRHCGVLYNWPAALAACPQGWHLPSDEEWTQLVAYLMDTYGLLNDWSQSHTNCVGNALKARRQIDSPLGGVYATSEHPRWDSIHTPSPERKTVTVNVGDHYGADLVGFGALPGGRNAYGSFTELGFMGFWWTSTECYTTRAWYRFMRHEFGDVTRSNFDKAAGLSVRCVRD